MFFPEGQVRVYVYGEPVDMRRSFDGLYALVKNEMKLDALSGHLFCFISRRATMTKILYWDRSGWALWAKRLERGQFRNANRGATHELDYTGLKMLLEGIEPLRVSRRYRLSGNDRQVSSAI
jgi:transposase